MGSSHTDSVFSTSPSLSPLTLCSVKYEKYFLFSVKNVWAWNGVEWLPKASSFKLIKLFFAFMARVVGKGVLCVHVSVSC